METFEHQITLPDGRVLGYAEYGDLNGRPLLYFHGGLSCRVDIAFAHEQSRALGIRVIAPDRPGIGLSKNKPGRTLLDWGSDVAALADILALDRFPVLGWSLGGPYAIACAYKLGTRVTQVGTIGGVGPMDRPGSVQQLGMLEDQWLLTCPPSLRWMLGCGLDSMARLPALWLQKTLEWHLKSTSDLDIVRRMPVDRASAFFIESMKQGAQGHLEDYAAAGQSWNFEVADLCTPLLMWQGDEDNICPMSAATALHDRVASSRLIVVPKHGHFLIHNKFSEIADVLLASP
jgi:pimeloyl-ACP methyl ester carboxylesterase